MRGHNNAVLCALNSEMKERRWVKHMEPHFMLWRRNNKTLCSLSAFITYYSAKYCTKQYDWLIALPVSTDCVWHAHAKTTQLKFHKKLEKWLGKIWCPGAFVFSIFRAFCIMNGYVQSVQMEWARKSDSKTLVKSRNRTSGTDLS